MKTTVGLPGQEPLTSEAGGWITCRVPHPGLAVAPPQLLAWSASSRPGNMRFSIVDGQVFLLGEVRDPAGWLSREEARARLFGPARVPAQRVSQVDVACILAEAGYEWSQPEDNPNRWRAVAADTSGHGCELTASITQCGVEVSGRLGSWDGMLSAPSREAIARFLAASHGQIRCARFTLQENEANAVSFAAADRLDFELPDSLAAVTVACRRGWREVRALADETVARAYLEATR